MNINKDTTRQQGEAQMSTHKLDKLAHQWLCDAAEDFSRHRGAVMMNDGGDKCLMVFGNDGYGQDPRAAAAADAMRSFCLSSGWETSEVFVEPVERCSWCFWTVAPPSKLRVLYERICGVWLAVSEAAASKKAG